MRRWASGRREAKRTMGKSGSQRNEVDTMVDYCTIIPLPPCPWMQRRWYYYCQLQSHLPLQFLRSRRQKWRGSDRSKQSDRRRQTNAELVVRSQELPFLSKEGNSRDRCNLIEVTAARIATTTSLVWPACCRMNGAFTEMLRRQRWKRKEELLCLVLKLMVCIQVFSRSQKWKVDLEKC